MSNRPDLRGPIIPGCEAAGILVGEPIRSWSELLFSAWGESDLSYGLSSMFEASYRFGKAAVEVVVDVRNGKIARVTVHSGYKGVLFGSIHVGMQVRNAIHVEPRLYYDEAEELILCRGIPGVSLDVPVVDPPPSQVPEMFISAISVFSPAINTPLGQDGEW